MVDVDPKDSLLVRDIRRKLLGDEKERFSDMAIICSDNERILASGLFLSMRCEYFEKRYLSVLHGNTPLSTPFEVRLHFPSEVVREVLEFVYTGRCALLDSLEKAIDDMKSFLKHPKKESEDEMETEGDDQVLDRSLPKCEKKFIYKLLHLTRAANFLSCGSLFHTLILSFRNLAWFYPYIACTVFEALWGENSIITGVPFIHFVQLFKKAPNETFLVVEEVYQQSPDYDADPDITVLPEGQDLLMANSGYGISELSATAIRALFALLTGHANCEYFFEALGFWSTGCKRKHSLHCSGSGRSIMDTNCITESVDLGERRKVAREIAHLFDFTQMSPLFIVDAVHPSGLLTPEKMLDVYRSLCRAMFKAESNN